MITCRILRLARSWFFALALGVTGLAVAEPVHAGDAATVRRGSAVSCGPVVPAAWYEEALNSRSRTIQVVFVIVLVGAFMLRRSS